MKTWIRTYSELIDIPTYIGRYRYLRLSGVVGKQTFGFDRYLNQEFYHSDEWKRVRTYVIARDLGRDLGMEGYDVFGRIYIHHMNPVTQTDILRTPDMILDPEFLICTSHNTHNAIHYGDEMLLFQEPVTRAPYDTCPWKR